MAAQPGRPAATIRHICDRQDLIPLTRARRLGLEPVLADRLDMYWANVPTAVGRASYIIEPNRDGTWDMLPAYGPHSPEGELAARARFAGSAEEAQQARWVAALVAGGYFAKDFETGACPHCGQQWAVGSTHAHRTCRGHILPHSYQCHRALVAAGFQPRWSPAHVEEPSLEDLGQL